MAIYREDYVDVELTSGGIFRSFLNHSVGEGDKLANRFGVRVFRNGEPVQLMDTTCTGYFIRNDGGTVVVSGQVTENRAFVTLNEACYAIEGQFALAIKLSGGSAVGTMRIVDGVVANTTTGTVIDPGTVVPSIEDLIDAIEAAVASIPLDYSALNAAVKGNASDQDIGFLADNEGKQLLADGTYNDVPLISYTDYIRIPENAVSVTVTGSVRNVDDTITYAISPNLFVYDANYTRLVTYGNSSLDAQKTFSLMVNGAKYIRVNQPAAISSTPKYIRFDYAKTDDSIQIISASHGGLVQAFVVSPTINAYLFNDGLFAMIGSGTTPTYSASDEPPWVSGGYLDMIKEFYFDDRITFTGTSFLFSEYDSSNNNVFGANRITKRVNMPKNMVTLGAGAFGAFDCNHVNLCSCSTLAHFAAFPPKVRNRHMILSVPKSLINATPGLVDEIVEALRSSVELEISGRERDWSYSNVTLYITDSQDLHDAIYEYVLTKHQTVRKNTAVILCNSLGKDGFPSYWNERMKNCISEIIPYMGVQLVYSRQVREQEEGDPTITFPVNGLTSLNTYPGMGWVNPYSAAKASGSAPVPYTDAERDTPNLYARVYTYDSIYSAGASSPYEQGRVRRYYELSTLSTFLGQPISTELGNLTMGLSCSGFVNFIFWRYFNENFCLSTSAEFYDRAGKLGQPLPIVPIDMTTDTLKPFDILCMKDVNEDSGNTDGGHVAIYLGTYTDGNGVDHLVAMQSTIGNGIAFGFWNFTGEEYETYYRLTTNSNNLRHHTITYQTEESDEDESVPEIIPGGTDESVPSE